MMHPQIPESPWLFYQAKSSTFDQLVEQYGLKVDAQVSVSRFNSLFSTPEDTASEVSSIPLPSPITFTNDHFHYPIEEDTLLLPSFMDHYLSMDLDHFGPFMSAHEGIERYQEESEESLPSHEGEDALSPTPSSMMSYLSSIQPSLNLPQEGMEIANHVSVPHMLEACGEAIGQGQKALAEVILRCMSQKVSPIAEPSERLAFYLSQDLTTTQGDYHYYYLKQEASKNFEQAFRAFFQGLPHGIVAHFAANSAILEAIPQDYEVIHIVDFDMGEGVQWPPIIEAIAGMRKTLKLTSIKWGEESSECVSNPWKFEVTRRQLYEHARPCGLKLMVEEKGIEEVVIEIKKMNKRSGKRYFLAFNCMEGFPHMGRGRSRRHVMEFLKVAKDLIGSSSNKGIVTFGDGGACEKLKNCLEFKSFFDGHLVHYQVLLESIESHFISCFLEARTVMECLFVAPYISSLGWLQKWEEMREESHLQSEIGLEGCRLSNAILMEVREMLRRSQGSYQASIEGQNGNELILEWKGTQLARVSTWEN